MMIITKTKDIFLKRLKRNKKMLTEQGSSDESKSNTLSRSIQLHTNTFLDSVDSSQLSKKTNQLRDELFPEFKENNQADQSYDSEVYDINKPSTLLEETTNMFKKQAIQPQDQLTDKLFKLTNSMALPEIADSQTVKINLSPSEKDVNSLICDFDQIDKEKVINAYKKLQQKEQRTNYSKNYEQQFNRFKKKHQMNIAPIDFNDQNCNHEKTLQHPKYRKSPRQTQQSIMEKQLKSRNLYEIQNITSRMSTYNPSRNSLFTNPSERRFEELQESYKTLQRFKPVNIHKHNDHEIRNIYENYDYRSRQKTNSYRQHLLPRQKSTTNIYQHKRYQNDFNDYQQVERKRNTQYYEQKSPYQSKQQDYYDQPHTQRYQPSRFQQEYVNEFIVEDQNRMKSQNSRFKDLKQYENKASQYHQQFQSKYIKEQKPPHIQNSTQKITKNQYFVKIEDKKIQHPLIEQIPHTYNQQSNYDEKQEKKKRIRQKAAQLLSRVRSHEYLTFRHQVPYHHRY